MSSTTTNGFWSGLVRRLFGGNEASLRESLEDVLEDAPGEDADFSREERDMLKNLLGFRDVRLDDVMVPRADIEAVDIGIETADLLRRFTACGHSRMPVFRDTLDQPMGMVHVKDVLTALNETQFQSLDISTLVRPVLFVPPSMPAMELLVKMQATRSHMALVIDEYGGTDGLVTIEDLIEEIVGEIEDEHDEEEVLLKELATGHWRANARLPVAELQEALGGVLPPREDIEDIDTLGGMVFALAGRVPERGERISADMPDGRLLAFTIRDGDARRIKTLDVRLSGRAQ